MTALAWQTRLNPALNRLTVYDVPPAQARARLHANESPQPWSDAALAAAAHAVREVELNRYPDTSGRKLRAVLGRKHDVDPDRIVLGNGSDEIISILLTAFSNTAGPPPRMVIPTPTFVMYEHSARVLGYETVTVPLTDTLELDQEAMTDALSGAALCFLARPNNPTSSLWDGDTIADFITSHPSTVFVVDEAYGAYAPGTSLFQPHAPANQVHMTTLSKIGLAALRLGYCICHPVLAEALNKCRHPYNISATTLAIAEVLLEHHGDELDRHLRENLSCRERLLDIVGAYPDMHVFPAHGNLVLCRLSEHLDPAHVVSSLASHGVRVKNVSSIEGLERCLRISIGTREELDLLDNALADAVGASSD